MTEDNRKTLPKDFDSDYSLPGRFEEGNTEYFDKPVKPKQTSKGIIIGALVFLVFSAGFIAYYFINQEDIDSRLVENTLNIDPEQRLVEQYGVGKYGSDHSHAAVIVFVNDEQINFGLPQFQLSSKYIHFENHNPYLLHRHATDVPLDMLFTSIGIKIDSECIILSNDNEYGKFCSGKEQSLAVYVNGERYYSDVSQYVINHNDRVLISYGDGRTISKQLEYLESLKIFDIPEKTPDFSGDNVSI